MYHRRRNERQDRVGSQLTTVRDFRGQAGIAVSSLAIAWAAAACVGSAYLALGTGFQASDIQGAIATPALLLLIAISSAFLAISDPSLFWHAPLALAAFLLIAFYLLRSRLFSPSQTIAALAIVLLAYGGYGIFVSQYHAI
jgi:hypothetical protein